MCVCVCVQVKLKGKAVSQFQRKKLRSPTCWTGTLPTEPPRQLSRLGSNPKLSQINRWTTKLHVCVCAHACACMSSCSHYTCRMVCVNNNYIPDGYRGSPLPDWLCCKRGSWKEQGRQLKDHGKIITSLCAWL